MKTLITLLFVLTGTLTINQAEALSPDRVTALREHLMAEATAFTADALTKATTEWNEALDLQETTNASVNPSVLKENVIRFANDDLASFVEGVLSLVPKQHRSAVVEKIQTLPFPKVIPKFVSLEVMGTTSYAEGEISLSPALSARTYAVSAETIAHELVHYYVQGDRRESSIDESAEKRSMPHTLSEGMTEFITLSALPHLLKEEVGHGDDVNSIASFVIMKRDEALWNWYCAGDEDAGWHILRPELEKALIELGMEEMEARRLTVKWDTKAVLASTDRVQAMLLSFQSMQFTTSVKQFVETFQNTQKAYKMFAELTAYFDSDEYAKQTVKPNLMETFDLLGIEFDHPDSFFGVYPEFLRTLVIPELKHTLDKKLPEGTTTNDATELRIRKAIESKEGESRMRALSRESELILKELLDELSTKKDELIAEQKRIQDATAKLRKDAWERNHLASPIIRRIIASPELTRKVRGSTIPEHLKVRLLTPPVEMPERSE